MGFSLADVLDPGGFNRAAVRALQAQVQASFKLLDPYAALNPAARAAAIKRDNEEAQRRIKEETARKESIKQFTAMMADPVKKAAYLADQATRRAAAEAARIEAKNRAFGRGLVKMGTMVKAGQIRKSGIYDLGNPSTMAMKNAGANESTIDMSRTFEGISSLTIKDDYRRHRVIGAQAVIAGAAVASSAGALSAGTSSAGAGTGTGSGVSGWAASAAGAVATEAKKIATSAATNALTVAALKALTPAQQAAAKQAALRAAQGSAAGSAWQRFILWLDTTHPSVKKLQLKGI